MSAAGGRPPTASLGLAGLPVAVFAVPGATARLEYDRVAIAGGEAWRLLMGHWTHWAPDHLVWDVLAFVALGVACERRSPGRCWTTLGVGGLAISLAIWVMEPGLVQYRGLSGLDAALFALLAVLVARGDPASGGGRRLAVWLGLAAFLAKVAYEAGTGTAVFVDTTGVAVVPLAHAVGALAGLAVGLADLAVPAFGRLTGWSRS